LLLERGDLSLVTLGTAHLLLITGERGLHLCILAGVLLDELRLKADDGADGGGGGTPGGIEVNLLHLLNKGVNPLLLLGLPGLLFSLLATLAAVNAGSEVALAVLEKGLLNGRARLGGGPGPPGVTLTLKLPLRPVSLLHLPKILDRVLFLLQEGDVLGSLVLLSKLGLREIADVIRHLLPGLEDLLHQPLHHGEDVDEVRTLDLVRLQAVGTLQPGQRLDDLFRQGATRRKDIVKEIRSAEGKQCHSHLLTDGGVFNEDDINIHIDSTVGETPSKASDNPVEGGQGADTSAEVSGGQKKLNDFSILDLPEEEENEQEETDRQAERDKTRQDKTRQDKTRQDKTRQDKTRLD